MRPEVAAEYQQKVIGRHELSGDVPETTRMSFDRLRTLYSSQDLGRHCSPEHPLSHGLPGGRAPALFTRAGGRPGVRGERPARQGQPVRW